MENKVNPWDELDPMLDDLQTRLGYSFTIKRRDASTKDFIVKSKHYCDCEYCTIAPWYIEVIDLFNEVQRRLHKLGYTIDGDYKHANT